MTLTQKINLVITAFFALIFTSCETSLSEVEFTNTDRPGAQAETWYFSEDFDISALDSILNRFDLSLPQTEGTPLTRSGMNFGSRMGFPGGITDISYSPIQHHISSNGEAASIHVTGSFSYLPFQLYSLVDDTSVLSIPVYSSGGGITSQTYTLPAYTRTDRLPNVYLLQYQNPENALWVSLQTYIQEAPKTPVDDFDARTNVKGNIPMEGGNYIISITGNYPSTPNEMVLFRGIETNNPSNLVFEIAVIEGEVRKSVPMTVKPNTSQADRHVTFQYLKLPASTEWKDFETHIQIGKCIFVPDFQLSMNVTSIPYTGGTYAVTMTGNFTDNQTDRMLIRAWSNNTVVSPQNAYFQGTMQKTTNITVLQNPFSSTRAVEFQYSLDNGITWITFKSAVQACPPIHPGGNYMYYALANPAPIPTWVALNDVKTGGNTGAVKGTQAQMNAACANYYERSDGRDRGTWRLPSIGEMQAIVEGKLRNCIGLSTFGFPAADGGTSYYWTTTQQLDGNIKPTGKILVGGYTGSAYTPTGFSSGSQARARCITYTRPY